MKYLIRSKPTIWENELSMNAENQEFKLVINYLTMLNAF